MKVQKLFQKTLFGVFSLFGVISLSTSVLCVYTVDTHLSEEYESNSKDMAKTLADASVDILLNRDLAALQSLIDQFVEIQSIRYIYITKPAILSPTLLSPEFPKKFERGTGTTRCLWSAACPGWAISWRLAVRFWPALRAPFMSAWTPV